MENIFDPQVLAQYKSRLEKLRPDSPANWGKMNAAQMLAHCNVTYEMVYEDKHPKPNAFVKLLLKWFVKPTVTNEVMYKKNSQTAPAFRISDERTFETEKQRLIQFMERTSAIGKEAFEGKESHSFGRLSANEWNNMFIKHLEHHFQQFGI